MKKNKNASMGVVIPNKLRIGDMTFYQRGGQVVGRVSNSMEKRSNTLPQFIQRQKLRHTTALWKMLRFCEPMFTQRKNAFQNFASLANRLPVVYVKKVLMDQATFLMSGIPVSDGTLPSISECLGEADGTPALITDLSYGDINFNEKLLLYTAVQNVEHNLPRVRFNMREVSMSDMTVIDGHYALVGEEFADEMKGWALVRVDGDLCSPQSIVTRCTFFQQYTTEEALEAAADSYGGLTGTDLL